MSNVAAQAYARTSLASSNPREIEAQALLKAARQLQDVQANWDGPVGATARLTGRAAGNRRDDAAEPHPEPGGSRCRCCCQRPEKPWRPRRGRTRLDGTDGRVAQSDRSAASAQRRWRRRLWPQAIRSPRPDVLPQAAAVRLALAPVPRPA